MPLTNLYVFVYNNYYNKIVKFESSLENYGDPIFVANNVNFNPSDGVLTEHVLGKADYEVNGDYLIVTDTDDNIISRWFIIDANFNRQGQWILTLKRDLLVDYYNNIINAPMIIDRAMLEENNPLIFNPEGFSFNQIKTSETLLTDLIGCPWLVLYMAKNSTSQNISVDTDNYSKADLTISTSLANSIFAAGTKTGPIQSAEFEVRASEVYFGPLFNDHKWNFNGDGYTDGAYPGIFGDSTSYKLNITPLYQDAFALIGNMLVGGYSTALSNVRSELPSDINLTQEAQLLSYNHKIIYSTVDAKYYRITVSTTITETNYSGSLQYGYAIYLNNLLSEYGSNPDNATFRCKYKQPTYLVSAEVLEDYNFTFTVDPANQATCNDAEYNIIALPYGNIRIYLDTTDPEHVAYSDIINKEIMLSMAYAIAKQFDASCYDLQLIPYCPLQDYIYDSTGIDTTYMNAKQFQNVSYDGKYYPIFYLTTCKYSFDILQQFNIPNFTGDNSVNKKIANECDTYRLCAPNYDSVFEFSVVKNDGVSSFNVDVMLRPYNPYIHVNPAFSGLYGNDFNDARGLVCNGDFSLTRITDAWVNYELQNKNYRKAFDRQIQNMDFNRRQEIIGQGLNVTAGTLQGGVTGGAAGGSVGGVYGAIAGAVVGTATSLAGGIADIGMSADRYAEQKSMALDNFRYQLGNIKALPYTINKIEQFTQNNKIFPFIEYYTSTDTEKNMLADYIQYKSMNVNAIGSISSYQLSDRTFIQGTLLRLEDTGLETHEVGEIYRILKEGVYI